MKIDHTKILFSDFPEVFQQRIQRFDNLFIEHTSDHHSFQEDELFAMEIGTIRQALSFVEFIQNKFVDMNPIFTAMNAMYGNWYLFASKYNGDIPYFATEDVNNPISSAFMLANIYLIKPEFIPYLHGMQAQTLGDARYYDDRKDVYAFLKTIK